MSTKKVILAKSADWDPWISFVQSRAINSRIWDLVNPDLPDKPQRLQPPLVPTFIIPPAGTPLNKDTLEIYKIQNSLYQTQLAEFERQQRAFGDLISFIQETVAAHVVTYFQKEDPHPWSILRALKLRLAPSDDARNLEIEQRYHRLCKGSGTQNIEVWLDDWRTTYTQAKKHSVAEVTGIRPVRDFLMAIRSKEPTFADTQLIMMKHKTTGIDFYEIVEEFRQYIRLQSLHQSSKDTHSAFATKSDPSGASFRGQKLPSKPCVCGDAHWLSDCPYLVPEKRTKGWKDAEKQKKVDEALKDNRTKAWVDKVLKKQKEKDGKSKSTPTSTPEPQPSPAELEETSRVKMGAFTSVRTAFLADTFDLHNSWILDNGSNSHVCNSTMQARFSKTHSAGPNDKLIAGAQILLIECFGSIDITVPTPSGPGIMTLLNVAYVPNFMTNLVSQQILCSKGLYFDDWKMHLHKQGKTIGFVKAHHGHYLLEDNLNKIVQTQKTATFTTTKKASMGDWPQILAHASPDVIKHLEQSVKGVKVTNKDTDRVPKTNECETCALSKAHQIVSRSPDKSENSTEPFHRITYDLMQFTTAMNKDQWVSHFACASTDFNLVFTHPRKSDATSIIRQALTIIETRYKGKIAFFRSDGEKALGIEFGDLIAEKGITFEPSAPDTPAQNGHSERKGGVLAMKARAMRIEAGLPVYLWHELMKTAGYIANRTPMQKHGWKTPFELAVKIPPNLSHLRKIGCKAYSLDKNIPCTQKLQERAHIGHLVGYDSTNIYRIWIPSQRKIIRTRDVTFDETSLYKPEELDLSQLTTEPMLETCYNIPALDPTTQITVIGSDEEDIGETQEESPIIQANKSQDIQTQNLPTPDPTEISLPESPTSEASYSREISADLDITNILPEGVTRRRKRKQAYAAALEGVTQGKVNVYHTAFSAFVTAGAYYTAAQGSRPETDSDTNLERKRFHRENLPLEPRSYHQMLKHPHAEGFKQAVITEITALQRKNTWTEVSYSHALKAGKTPIPTTWVFKYKFDDQGYLTKYKARLCARGDLQHTEQDTFAATVAARIFRALMALVAAFDLETRQYDAVNAFANSPIDEPVYCKVPQGWTGSNLILLLLLRALYGLKQSPALWYKQFSQTLIDLGLEPVSGIDCLFTNDYMLLFFFVDDVVVLYHHQYVKKVDDFQARLFETYEMRYLGELEWFLGIRVVRDRTTHRLWLCQDSYIDKIAAKFNISTATKFPGAPLPIGELTKSTGQATPQEIYAYQQRVGSINFSAVITRADTADAASKLSQYLTNPSKHHLECANQVLRYLIHTKDLAIEFDGRVTIPRKVFLASSDASFGNDPDTRASSQGYVFLLFNGPIDWKASKQKTVTTSTTEAELLAISSAAKETIWWTRFFDTIDFNPGHQVHIQCDNMQTIRAFTSDTAKFTTKLRHVDIHRHWLKQEVRNKRIAIEWTSSDTTIADGLTKSLPPQRHKEFVRLVGLRKLDLGVISGGAES